MAALTTIAALTLGAGLLAKQTIDSNKARKEAEATAKKQQESQAALELDLQTKERAEKERAAGLQRRAIMRSMNSGGAGLSTPSVGAPAAGKEVIGS